MSVSDRRDEGDLLDEAQYIVEQNGGVAELRERKSLVDDKIDEEVDTYRRAEELMYYYDHFSKMAARRPAGRVVDQLETTEGPEDASTPQDPVFVLRSESDTLLEWWYLKVVQTEMTAESLSFADPCDAWITVRGHTTWERVRKQARSRHDNWEAKFTESERKLGRLHQRADTYERLLERLALGDQMPWNIGGEERALVEDAGDVFDSRTRPEGSRSHIAYEVIRWAKKAYWHYRDGRGAEAARDKVLGLAEQHDYHFSRRQLRRWIDAD